MRPHMQADQRHTHEHVSWPVRPRRFLEIYSVSDCRIHIHIYAYVCGVVNLTIPACPAEDPDKSNYCFDSEKACIL